MESDKENVCNINLPISRETRPVFSTNFIAENRIIQKNDKTITRVPLQTINSHLSPKPGPSKAAIKQICMNHDTGIYTFRDVDEILDGNYDVYNDKPTEKDNNILNSYDDGDDHAKKENNQRFVENKKELGHTLSSGTPNVKGSLKPHRIRNLKRSLRRPHSRELQGLSPFNNQDNVDNKVKRRLHFGDGSKQNMWQSSDIWDRSAIGIRCLSQNYAEDIYDYLLDVEKKPLGVPRISSITRACIINWLLKVNGANGNPSLIQTACWYLDSILYKGCVQLDKLQLVAVACYWIAQKLHGPVNSAVRLIKCANNAFTVEKLRRAEKIVLMLLEFPPQPVVPQEYITYLALYCGQNNEREISVGATFISMCGLIVDKTLCDEYPSVIAVAAIRNAMLMLNKKELLCRLHMCRVFQAAEVKTSKLFCICSFLRAAVRTVSAPTYEYKTLLTHYGSPPSYIAQRIVTAARESFDWL